MDMNNLENEILNLTYDLVNNSCQGCVNNWPSQKDHVCLTDFHYNLQLEEALHEAIAFVGEKYNIQLDSPAFFFHLKKNLNGSSND